MNVSIGSVFLSEEAFVSINFFMDYSGAGRGSNIAHSYNCLTIGLWTVFLNGKDTLTIGEAVM